MLNKASWASPNEKCKSLNSEVSPSRLVWVVARHSRNVFKLQSYHLDFNNAIIWSFSGVLMCLAGIASGYMLLIRGYLTVFFCRIPIPAIAKTHNQGTASSDGDYVRSERVKSISLSWPDSYTDRQTMANSCISWPFGRYLQGQICAEKALIWKDLAHCLAWSLLLKIWKRVIHQGISKHNSCTSTLSFTPYCGMSTRRGCIDCFDFAGIRHGVTSKVSPCSGATFPMERASPRTLAILYYL